MFASGDPINLILVCFWTVLLSGCIALGWYAYFLWKRNPYGSISNRVALLLRAAPRPAVFGAGMISGLAIGTIFGMFAGHFAWAVEIEVPAKVAFPWKESELPTMEEIHGPLIDEAEIRPAPKPRDFEEWKGAADKWRVKP